MTAPAYMAKVLKVDISVVAPEKSIVPWAWAMLAKERVIRVGATMRTARIHRDEIRRYGNRVACEALRDKPGEAFRWDISTSVDWDQPEYAVMIRRLNRLVQYLLFIG